jgi:hypothetical protein
MTMKLAVLLGSIVLILPACTAGPSLTERSLPPDLSEKAYKHIEYLAALNDRTAGIEGEKAAAEYIRNQFDSIGLSVKTEPFALKSFFVDEVSIEIEGQRFEPETVCFNPYEGVHSFQGDAFLLGPDVSGDSLAQINIEGESVITAEPVSFFSLLPKAPGLIVYLSSDDYGKVGGLGQGRFHLEIEGEVTELESANVVGVLEAGSEGAKEIILTAHYDSYHSPGADDNASGVGVLIELARFFKSIQRELPLNIKFVGLGAEEFGGLGSRMYVKKHEKDLDSCELVFNMDVLGGRGNTVVETVGGVKGIPEAVGESRLPESLKDVAWEGMNGRWRILPPPEVLSLLMGTTNYPYWLVKTITESANELGHEITPAGPLGGDSMFFAEAGVVATSIGVIGNVTNSPLDTIDNVNKESLKTAGEIVAAVVLRTMSEPSGSRAEKE